MLRTANIDDKTETNHLAQKYLVLVSPGQGVRSMVQTMMKAGLKAVHTDQWGFFTSVGSGVIDMASDWVWPKDPMRYLALKNDADFNVLVGFAANAVEIAELPEWKHIYVLTDTSMVHKVVLSYRREAGLPQSGDAHATKELIGLTKQMIDEVKAGSKTLNSKVTFLSNLEYLIADLKDKSNL